MSLVKRTQGRPPRESGINGRDKLIEATRHYLRSNRKLNLTRTEIAQECGVTPALISYYFKDKQSLVDAVTKPLIRAYSGRLHTILHSGLPADERMREAVRLMIEMYVDNSFLFDHMQGGYASNRLDDEDRATFETFRRSIAQLVSELIEADLWRASDPDLTELALCGMARAFGEAIRLRDGGPSGVLDGADLEVDFICRVLGGQAAIKAAAVLAVAD